MAARNRAAFDANVIVRALVDGASDAVEWIESLRDRTVRAIAPDLIYAETSHALVRHIRTGNLGLPDAVGLLTAVTAFPLEVRESRALCGIALPLAVAAGLTGYDAQYLALAEAEDAVLVTADKALAAAATRSVLLE